MDVSEEVEILLEGLDENDPNSILGKCVEIISVRKKLNELEGMLKDKLKAYMKERGWDRYVDKDTKVSVKLSMQKREIPDKKQLELMLTPDQMAIAFRTISYEKMSIITPKDRERLKKYV